ncbi:MAG: hypothetical protein R3C14_07355 [Caldilineaceae bacterium]
MRRFGIILLALAILIPALRLTAVATGYAQSIPGIGIGTNTPDPSAILDIDFINKGVLFPRLTTAQRDAISAPATGLLIYNTDSHVLEVYDGSAWQ